jgi:glycosyltransferase involved in cell wall biosynthesis
MNDERFTVSVIIPVFNGGKYLAAALESVSNQSLPPAEILVVDDGSRDRSADIARSFSGVTLISEPHRGLAAARNRGIRQASGDYLAHLDADDLWMPDKLLLQIRQFRQNPRLDIVGGYMEPFFSEDLPERERSKIYCPPAPIPGFSASVLLVRTAGFHRVGWYREDLRVAADLEWFIRARGIPLQEGMVTEILARRRLHKSNSDILNRRFNRERLVVLRDAIKLRRNSHD